MLAALHAFRAAGRRLPVNLVLLAEGEEEIGSPNFINVFRDPEVLAAMSRAEGVIIPANGQAPNGAATITLGAKGIIECELVASGERWGRGPARDIHSSLKAQVDSPVWHLVEALKTLVTDHGNRPAIDGWFEHVRPLTARERALIAEGAAQPQRGGGQALARRASAGSTTCRGGNRSSGWSRSRRSISKGWSPAIPGRAARRSCRRAESPSSI